MPVALSYPGVYIEEVPSGVRTITGVATSITAFIGRASRGPANEPTTINSFGDFERQFGGLGLDYPMSYAVKDFYMNGGAQAVIVRLFKAGGASDDGKSRFTIDDLKLAAVSPGVWGNKLRASIDLEVSDDLRASLGLGKDDPFFNISLRDARQGGATERIRNVSVKKASPRRIDRVLAAESSLARWDGDWPTTDPALAKWGTARDKLKALNDALGKSPQVPADIKKAQDEYDTALKDLENPAAQAESDLAAAIQAKDAGKITAAQAAMEAAESAMKADDGAKLDTSGDYEGRKADKTGLYALDKADLFNLLCVPPDSRPGDTPAAFYQTAMAYCQLRRAMLIVDSPAAWSANKDTAAAKAKEGLSALGLSGEAARNAALYFPRVSEPDPLRKGQTDIFVPCGIIAGVMARTDASRGVWKAPAGLDASINGIADLEVNLSDAENGMLNPLGINCLRSFPINGRVVWGARTLRGADQLADEYKYVPVRRLALFLEESLYRGTQWVVFEPNDEPLWAQIRLNIGAFMQNLFRQGAFQGASPKEAYFVRCDSTTTTQTDINLGIVNIIVGFAPLKPAEFVVIKLQQIAGDIPT